MTGTGRYNWHWNERANKIFAQEITPMVLDKSSMANEMAERRPDPATVAVPVVAN